MFKNHSKMTFDLDINFKGIEIKSGSINLIFFLKINNRIANLINPICNFNVHVNFAETIIESLQIIGEIDTVFNHKHFTIALMEFQKKYEKNWVGHFTYQDKVDVFTFNAPKFSVKKVN